MLLLLSLLAHTTRSDYTPCFTTSWLQDNNVPFRDGAPHDAPPIKLGLPIWMSGQSTANMIHILIKEVVGYEIDLIGSATYASGGLLFDAIDGNLDLVVEIWDILNPEDIQDALFTTGNLTGYNTLGYVSGDGLFVPDYCMNTTYWASQGISWPSLFTSMFEQGYVDFFTEQGTFDAKQWIMNTTGLGEPSFEFHLPELCAAQQCITWIMLDQLYAYNRYQSLVRNYQLPVRILTWDYMATVFYAIPALVAAQKPFMTMSFFPDTFQLQYNLQDRIYFPQATASCYSEQNSTSQQGHGSYNCGFAETKNWKLGSSSFHQNTLYEDLTTNGFLNKATLLQDEITTMLQEIVTNGSTPHDAACNWLHANADTWRDWITITPDTVGPDSAEQKSFSEIIGIISACITGTLFLLYGAWFFGLLGRLEIVMFDTVIIYLLKIWFDILDLIGDILLYFEQIMPSDAPSRISIAYMIIIAVSGTTTLYAIYIYFKHAMDAYKTSAHVKAEDVTEKQMLQLRARDSLMKGLQNHSFSAKTSNLYKVEDLEEIWAQEELNFADKRINDCKINMAITLTEDLPILLLTFYYALSSDAFGITDWYVLTAYLMWKSLLLGMRFSAFSKILTYRKQKKYATKAHEIHERQKQVQLQIKSIGKPNKVHPKK